MEDYFLQHFFVLVLSYNFKRSYLAFRRSLITAMPHSSFLSYDLLKLYDSFDYQLLQTTNTNRVLMWAILLNPSNSLLDFCFLPPDKLLLARCIWNFIAVDCIVYSLAINSRPYPIWFIQELYAKPSTPMAKVFVYLKFPLNSKNFCVVAPTSNHSLALEM